MTSDCNLPPTSSKGRRTERARAATTYHDTAVDPDLRYPPYSRQKAVGERVAAELGRSDNGNPPPTVTRQRSVR